MPDVDIRFLYPHEDGGKSLVTATVGEGFAEHLEQLIIDRDSTEKRIMGVVVDGETQGWGNFRPDFITMYKVNGRMRVT